MVDIVTELFREAAQDYFFMLNRGYPENASAKLVGDRYRLNGLERIILYRGITSEKKSIDRKSKMNGDIKEKKIYIDGYNVLFSIMNYLTGKLIYIGNDGFLRDCGEGYGKIEDESKFYRAVNLLLSHIVGCETATVDIYFDSPVSGSALHANGVEKRLIEANLTGEVFLVKSADGELKEKSGGIIATSDSEIIDSSACQVVDLARRTLQKNFKIEILDLGDFL